MAGEDQKERDKAQAGGATSRRLDRREVLKGLLLPHLVVRIGWQAIGRSDLPVSPRRPVDDVLDT